MTPRLAFLMSSNVVNDNVYNLLLGETERNIIGKSLSEKDAKEELSGDSSIKTDVALRKIGKLNETMRLAKGRKGYANLSLIYQALSTTSEAGLTTRQIADICGLSIYVTRNWLTKLNEAGVICCHLFDGKSLGWTIDL
ncbi:hypothetical protein CIK43_23410 [Citrobacter sp. TSA-1]|nr:hypothetical protein CIK43_23410 [Citrobacter sp. TSA-1]